MIIHRIMPLAMAIILSGCFQGHTYVSGKCITCLNNPFTGDALNYDKQSPEYAASSEKELQKNPETTDQQPARLGETRASVRVDIDTAYTKIKREFGFLTRKEWRKQNLQWDDNFQWEALPGVSYHMRDYVEHHYLAVTRKHYIDVQLDKNIDLTDIRIQFSIRESTINIDAYARSLKARALKAMKAS